MKLDVSDSEVFIWTEALGCGKILHPMLSSYLTHHKFKIYVIGYEEDLKNLPNSSLVRPIVVNQKNANQNKVEIGTTESELRSSYEKGHYGTATLWASIIISRNEKFLIHLDADTVFLGDVVTPVLEKLTIGFGVVGTRRPYRFRSSRMPLWSRIQLHFSRDCVNTHAFGFVREFIGFPKKKIIDLIMGDSGSKILNRLHPVIDFFDRITLHLTRIKGIYYLDSNHQERNGKHNRYGCFESKMISFSAVGSGYAFFHGHAKATSTSYERFAIASYALYSSHLLGEKIGVASLESPYLEEKLARLDSNNWRLKEIEKEP